MRQKIQTSLIAILFSGLATTSIAQCECYTVENIEIPLDTTGIMKVTFSNTCDFNVYLSGWVINNVNDTIAAFDECICGSVLPFNTDVSWDFNTSLTALPDINTLHVAITNGTLDCPAVAFDIENAVAEVKAPGITVTLNSGILQATGHAGSTIRSLEVFDIAGHTIRSTSGNGSDMSLDVSDLSLGLLLVRSTDDNYRTSTRRLVDLR
ncbi:MAG: hypothetical protein ACOH13_00820 [Flavobacteriales bacterium]